MESRGVAAENMENAELVWSAGKGVTPWRIGVKIELRYMCGRVTWCIVHHVVM